ncbi:hypothetical protein SP36_13 [Salmonella phage 36]|uniref:Uncharacterized protein n=1 Tax=Salmonella phage 36 TaxID=1654889 RepID=A0A0N7CA24_9CAUD|nr:hypothetical protein SP36_13 [Salmonella phage 36]AKJ73985.1 hypothetical protein SP36_13 [Salmonella phage 36]
MMIATLMMILWIPFDAVNIELNLADNAVDRMKRLAGLAKR